MDVNLPTFKIGIYSPRLYNCICVQCLTYTELSIEQKEIFDQNTELTYIQEAPQKATELTERRIQWKNKLPL